MEKILTQKWINTEFNGNKYRFFIENPHHIKYGKTKLPVTCAVSIEILGTCKFLFWEFKYWSEFGERTHINVEYYDYTYYKNQCYFDIKTANKIFQTALNKIHQTNLDKNKEIEKWNNTKILNKI